jgi:predicted amidophosphoribosyltransferase
MKCPKCQRENIVVARFSEERGTPLAGACANCGSEVSATAKFCWQCGDSLQLIAEDSRFAAPKMRVPVEGDDHGFRKIITQSGGT